MRGLQARNGGRAAAAVQRNYSEHKNLEHWNLKEGFNVLGKKFAANTSSPLRRFRLPLICLGAGLAIALAAQAQNTPATAPPKVIEVQNLNRNLDAAPLIQEALDRACKIKAAVKIPAGRWRLSHQVVVPGNTSLEGAADDTTLAPAETNSSDPVLLQFPVSITNVLVKKLTFDGGGSNFTNTSPVLSATACSHLVFDGVTVQNSRGIGLLLQGGVKSSGVRNSRFLNLGNHWKTTLNKADRIQGLVFCCGESNLDNFATGNYFQDIGLDALQIGDQTGFYAASNVFELANNQFNLVAAPDYPAGIFALHSAKVMLVSNIVHAAAGNGIDAPGLQNSCLSNNLVSGCGGCGIGLFPGYDGARQTRDVSVIKNTVTDNVHWHLSSFVGGITIAGGNPRDIRISDNTVTDTQAEKTQAYGLQVRENTTVTGLVIDPGNHLGETSGAGFPQK